MSTLTNFINVLHCINIFLTGFKKDREFDCLGTVLPQDSKCDNYTTAVPAICRTEFIGHQYIPKLNDEAKRSNLSIYQIWKTKVLINGPRSQHRVCIWCGPKLWFLAAKCHGEFEFLFVSVGLGRSLELAGRIVLTKNGSLTRDSVRDVKCDIKFGIREEFWVSILRSTTGILAGVPPA